MGAEANLDPLLHALSLRKPTRQQPYSFTVSQAASGADCLVHLVPTTARWDRTMVPSARDDFEKQSGKPLRSQRAWPCRRVSDNECERHRRRLRETEKQRLRNLKKHKHGGSVREQVCTWPWTEGPSLRTKPRCTSSYLTHTRTRAHTN